MCTTRFTSKNALFAGHVFACFSLREEDDAGDVSEKEEQQTSMWTSVKAADHGKGTYVDGTGYMCPFQFEVRAVCTLTRLQCISVLYSWHREVMKG